MITEKSVAVKYTAKGHQEKKVTGLLTPGEITKDDVFL